MSEGKYLPLYYKWLTTGETNFNNGMCDLFTGEPEWSLVIPTEQDRENNGHRLCAWWGSGRTEKQWLRIKKDFLKRRIECEFTPLRQNIVLLMAAMNGEL